MIHQKLGFIYDTQVVKNLEPPAVKDGLYGRNKYVDYGSDGYRQIQSQEDVGFLGNAVHWLSTMTGLKPAYKATEYLCTDHGRKVDHIWNQLKDDITPEASAKRSNPELSFEDCEIIQKDHPIHLLPDELVTHIFSYLDVPSVSRVTQTCKRWKHISETSGVGISNFHLNPVMIQLDGHKAGKYLSSELTQVEGSTKVVTTINLIKESALGENNFGIFFDPWNGKAGIILRYISRSPELTKNRAVLVALQNDKKGWTGKTIHNTSENYRNNKIVAEGKVRTSHDPAQFLLMAYEKKNLYLKRLVSGKACGGMDILFSLMGKVKSLNEGPRLVSGHPVIQSAAAIHEG